MKLKGRKRTKTERGSRQKHDVEEKKPREANTNIRSTANQGREKVQWQKIKNHSSYGFVCFVFLLRSVVNG